MAGRTKEPVKQPVPIRVGGFGGAAGLTTFLTEGGFDLLVDATHPYAARISANAAEAARLTGVPLVSLSRPAWVEENGDRWERVGSVEEAVTALGSIRRYAFLALGRQELLPFETAPQHSYLIRSVDPVEPPLAVPNARYMTARGPFALADEIAMLKGNDIDVIVSKNSGGAAAYAKIEAARVLDIPVIMIDRPPRLQSSAIGMEVLDIETALTAIRHQLSLLEKRGE